MSRTPHEKKWTTRKITVILLLTLVVGLIFFDFWAVGQGGFEATISRVIYDTAREWPILPFLGGFLCGHLFWPQKME